MKSIDDMIKDKEASHGSFTDTAVFAQELKALLRKGRNWGVLGDESREALELAATKLARILNGHPDEPAHWNGAAAALRIRAMALSGGVAEIETNVARLARMRTVPLAETKAPIDG